MLQTGPPLQTERPPTPSVSPTSFRHVSRTPTPRTSSVHGTQRPLDTLPPPPPRRSRSLSDLDMAVKPGLPPTSDHPDPRSRLEPLPTTTPTDEAQVAPVDPSPESLSAHTTEEIGDHEDFEDSQLRSLPSLFDLEQSLRLERDHRRQCNHIHARLWQDHVAATRGFRLRHTARSVQRTLGECIKSEDKHSFVNLYNAFQDAVARCAEVPNPEEISLQDDARDPPGYPLSWLDRLPATSRDALLDFISKVRHDADYIADRLAALTQKELLALLPDKGQAKSSESVFGSTSRTSSRASRHLGFVADGQTDLLSSYEFGSALEVLIYGVRGLTPGRLSHDRDATDLWASVCARLILEQKPGSEKFVPAVVDLWAGSSEWPGKDRLVVWISETLRKGSHILEQPSKQSFRVRANAQGGQSIQDEQQAEAFYLESVKALFALLIDASGPSAVPEGAKVMSQAISSKLECSHAHKQAFPNFILTRWLSSSTFLEIITSPETHGMFTDYFISDLARHRILREVASRFQKAIFDVSYPWKISTPASSELTDLTHSLASEMVRSKLTPQDRPSVLKHAPSSSSELMRFVSLLPADIHTLIYTLHPPRPYGPASSDAETIHTGLQSSSSSLSGFSLFQNPANPSGQNAGQVFGWDSIKPDFGHEAIPDQDRCDFADWEKIDQATIEGDSLREICSVMEDILANRPISGAHDWVLLVQERSTRQLISMRDALSKASNVDGSRGDTTPVRSRSSASNRGYTKSIREALTCEDAGSNRRTPHSTAVATWAGEIQADLMLLFSNLINFAEDSSDFVSAHKWFREMRKVQTFLGDLPNPSLLWEVLDSIGSRSQGSLRESLSSVERCREPLVTMQRMVESEQLLVTKYVERFSLLRMKMWYVSEVRTSATYDEARSVASALKVMGKAKNQRRTRPLPTLRHSTGSKSATAGFHLKSDTQVLELLSASPEHGGPNKLSDDQARALSTWMDRNTIENLCPGEERLQRLTMEVRKSVTNLTSAASTTWSSSLFARENAMTSAQMKNGLGSNTWTSSRLASRFDALMLQTNVPPSIDSISSAASHPLSARSSRDYLDTRSPTLTNKSSMPFWSPAITEAHSPSSATSIGSSQKPAIPSTSSRTPAAVDRPTFEAVKEQTRQLATSLLLSDLGTIVFPNGSETDQAFWTGVGGELTDKLLHAGIADSPSPRLAIPGRTFDFDGVFQKLLRSFAATSNPMTKLGCLHDIDTLLLPYMAETGTERVQGLLFPSSKDTLRNHAKGDLPSTDIKIKGFRKVLSNRKIRPATVFRDMQYIAALVPTESLGSTRPGRAYCNAVAALMSIKDDACSAMVETADNIIAFHSNNRGSGRSSSTAQQERDSAAFPGPTRTPSAEDVGHYTMAHAAELLQITAKEGKAVAQRELATLYLTHPELMDHIIAPLSRPRDVFKEELESKWRKNQDPNRSDPTTMCVAHHWMSLSSKGGDSLAREYLRQREEMDRLG